LSDGLQERFERLLEGFEIESSLSELAKNFTEVVY
jgi:hypothetical protein